jgi:DNA-binding LacI/PurR family transcriptional regulator
MNELTIAVLLDTEFEYGVGVLEGVRDFGRSRPAWRVLPVAHTQEALLTRLVRSGELRGVIGTFVSDRWIESRFQTALPVVNTYNLSHVTCACSVVPDDAAVGRLVARHFCDLGCARAAVISERATAYSQLRREGFIAHLREHGVEVSEPGGAGAFRLETGWQAWMSELRQDTAVFCTDDHLARRFWDVCKGTEPSPLPFLGVLAGAGDSLTDRVVSGLDLTSVALPARAVGWRAAARLARLLEGEREIVREMVPPEELIVRGSTARYASPDAVVARAMGLALQTLAQNPGVDELARRIGVSRRTLELRFHAAFGHGPAEEIRSRRLLLAKRLLAETGLTVAEVSARVGGGSVQAFTTLFRRACGCPPAEFRRASRTGLAVRIDHNQ